MVVPVPVLALQVPVRGAATRGLGVGWTIVLAALVGSAALIATVLLLERVQRRRRAEQIDDEYRTRLLMEDLCPDGWKAQITVFGRHAPRPEDAPSVDGTLVALEWSEYAQTGDGEASVTVVRRIWERSIGAAQARMIAERRLDLVLEDAERRVLGGEPPEPQAP
jgi:hypothetical protein